MHSWPLPILSDPDTEYTRWNRLIEIYTIFIPEQVRPKPHTTHERLLARDALRAIQQWQAFSAAFGQNAKNSCADSRSQEQHSTPRLWSVESCLFIMSFLSITEGTGWNMGTSGFIEKIETLASLQCIVWGFCWLQSASRIFGMTYSRLRDISATSVVTCRSLSWKQAPRAQGPSQASSSFQKVGFTYPVSEVDSNLPSLWGRDLILHNWHMVCLFHGVSEGI